MVAARSGADLVAVGWSPEPDYGIAQIVDEVLSDRPAPVALLLTVPLRPCRSAPMRVIAGWRGGVQAVRYRHNGCPESPADAA